MADGIDPSIATQVKVPNPLETMNAFSNVQQGMARTQLYNLQAAVQARNFNALAQFGAGAYAGDPEATANLISMAPEVGKMVLDARTAGVTNLQKTQDLYMTTGRRIAQGAVALPPEQRSAYVINQIKNEYQRGTIDRNLAGTLIQGAQDPNALNATIQTMLSPEQYYNVQGITPYNAARGRWAGEGYPKETMQPPVPIPYQNPANPKEIITPQVPRGALPGAIPPPTPPGPLGYGTGPQSSAGPTGLTPSPTSFTPGQGPQAGAAPPYMNAGAFSRVSPIGPSPLPNIDVPNQYQPIIAKAATDANVPPELLTRLLSAESDFNPKAVSKKGAQGIAQFIPSTAKDYNVTDPNDVTQAIPAAAKYLADLHDKTGSWKGAVDGYLGGNSQRDRSYTNKGVWQLANRLDSTPVSNQASGTQTSRIWPNEVIGDSIAQLVDNHAKVGGNYAVGRPSDQILATINMTNPDNFKGKNVVLSSGLSNSPDKLNLVPQMIDKIKEDGGNVALLGVGPKFAALNPELQKIADSKGVPFIPLQGPFRPDGVHMVNGNPTLLAANKIASSFYNPTSNTPGAGQQVNALAAPGQQATQLPPPTPAMQVAMLARAEQMGAVPPGSTAKVAAAVQSPQAGPQVAPGQPTPLATQLTGGAQTPPVVPQQAALPPQGSQAGPQAQLVAAGPDQLMAGGPQATPNLPPPAPGINPVPKGAITGTGISTPTEEAKIGITAAVQGAQEEYKNASTANTGAQSGMQYIPQLEQAFKEVQTGKLTQANLTANQWFIATMNAMGIQLSKEEYDLAAKGELIKVAGGNLAFDRVRTLGAREAVQVVQQVMSIKPNLLNTPQGNRLVLEGIKQDFQRAIDKYQFMNDWTDPNNTKTVQVGGNTIQVGGHTDYRGAAATFDKLYPAIQYASRVTPLDLPQVGKSGKYDTSHFKDNVMYNIPNKDGKGTTPMYWDAHSHQFMPGSK